MSNNQETKQTLSNIDSTVASTYEDLKDIGDTVDYSQMTLEQLKEEFRKFRKENADFRWEVRKIIVAEIEKQIKPLTEQLQQFTNEKKKVVYIKFRVPLLDFLKWLWHKLSNGITRLFASAFNRPHKSKDKR